MASDNQNRALPKQCLQHEVHTVANANDTPPTMMGHRAGRDGDSDRAPAAGSFVPRRRTADELARVQNISQLSELARDAMAPSMADYVNHGAEDGESLLANQRGLGRYSLRPRVLRDVSGAETSTAILHGRVRLDFPVCVAPFAGCRALHPEGEAAVASAAAGAGTVYTVPNWASIPLPRIAAESSRGRGRDVADDGDPRPPPLFFQLYPHKPTNANEGIHREHMKALLRYLSAACDDRIAAVVVTCDTVNNGNRERTYKNPQWCSDVIEQVGGFPVPCALQGADLPPVAEEGHPASMTWEDIHWMRRECERNRLALILKGVMTREDAALAARAGVDAIIVSNHGGRQLDGTRGTAEIVEECVEATTAAGSAMEVYVDGGIRRGKDVAKCLALGARCVFVGRPALWGLATGGQDGVARALDILRDEFREVLELMGCRSPRELTRASVARDDEPQPDRSAKARANQDGRWIMALFAVALASYSLGRSSNNRRV